MSLRTETVPIGDLSAGVIETLQTLMQRYYDGVSPARFRSDLREKSSVLLIRNANDTIVGFSTMLLSDVTVGSQVARVLFSGDTIVDKAYWGQTALFRSFARLLTGLLEQRPDPLYWLLLTKGIRTYLLLPLYFKAYYPGIGQARREFECALARRVAAERYGIQFQEQEWIVRPDPPADRLRPEYAAIPAHRQRDAHVQFYLKANPGYRSGDELVSIAHVSYENFTRAMSRLFRVP